MAKVELIPADETHARRATRRARQARRRLRPLADMIPHVVVTREKALADRRENRLIVFALVRALRPELGLLENVLTETLPGELGRLLAAVSVEDAEVGERDRTVLLVRVQSLQCNGKGVLCRRASQVNADDLAATYPCICGRLQRKGRDVCEQEKGRARVLP